MEPDAVNVPMEAPGSPKEGLLLSARSMTATNAAGGTFGLGLDQFELPKASIAKLARSELRKDTLTALVKSASVFVSYLTLARGNKTIAAAHVMDAMRELDFPTHMRRELREQLDTYRELQKKQAAARAEAAQQSRERAKAARAAAAAAESMEVEETAPDHVAADEVPDTMVAVPADDAAEQAPQAV